MKNSAATKKSAKREIDRTLHQFAAMLWALSTPQPSFYDAFEQACISHVIAAGF